MGKHSSDQASTGSLFSSLKPKKSSQQGRHSDAVTVNSAGGVLSSVRSRPVLAAFMVPAIATAAVVGSSMVMPLSPTEDSGPQVVADAPAVSLEEPTAVKDEALERAKEQAAAKPGKASISVKTEAPSESPSKSSSAAGENDGPSKSGDSAGKSGSCPMSFYGGGDGFDGRPTASGEKFDTNKLTAAHKSLPFGSKVEITNKANGKSVTVRINDRGPYSGSRCIDLSKAAMEAVGGVNAGEINGSYKVL